ncbi:hypothetical protein C1645_736742 [Glomus cerebriforme]|uniref:Uncharacterized protein n=1 Tax=Glomus cerebriforme TaxID=658196 RepID=A0A397T3Q2_9GLOM|nr:hypothetical protein C1645_736742 [Glomus cerebriforme]
MTQEHLIQSLGNEIKVKAGRFLNHAEKYFHEYQAFTKDHPFLGLFIAIFSILAIMPVLCFTVFSFFTTFITLGSAIALIIRIIFKYIDEYGINNQSKMTNEVFESIESDIKTLKI